MMMPIYSEKLVYFLFEEKIEDEFYNLMCYYIVENSIQINLFIAKLEEFLECYREELALRADLEIYNDEEAVQAKP